MHVSLMFVFRFSSNTLNINQLLLVCPIICIDDPILNMFPYVEHAIGLVIIKDFHTKEKGHEDMYVNNITQ